MVGDPLESPESRSVCTWARAMRIFGGPDEVHVRTAARRELRRYEN